MFSITATDLPRLMACNGSRLLESEKLSTDADNIVRDEGNALHWLIQQAHEKRVNLDEMNGVKSPNGIIFNNTMIDHVREHLEIIGENANVEHYADLPDHFGKWIINGRADSITKENGTLYIDDFKYGWSIVEPELNWTLISHACAVFYRQNFVGQKIVFRIHQPRPYHPKGSVRTWEISDRELHEYYLKIVSVMDNPDNILRTGEHCYRCPHFASCPAATKAQMNCIDLSEQAFTDKIDNQTLSKQLDNVDRAIKVLTEAKRSYQELASHRLKKGEIIDNYCLDRALGDRKWNSYLTPEIAKILTGKDLSKQELITPAQAEKLGVSKEIVDSLCSRSDNGFNLKRIDVDTKAKKMFQPKGK